MVELINRRQCCELNRLDLLPGSLSADHFGFVETVDFVVELNAVYRRVGLASSFETI